MTTSKEVENVLYPERPEKILALLHEFGLGSHSCSLLIWSRYSRAELLPEHDILVSENNHRNMHGSRLLNGIEIFVFDRLIVLDHNPRKLYSRKILYELWRLL